MQKPGCIQTAELISLLRDEVGGQALVLDPENLCEFEKNAGTNSAKPEITVDATSVEQGQAIMIIPRVIVDKKGKVK